MAIISTFFATRTLARNAKVDLGGKVIDNGSTAEAGKRWELQYEAAKTTEVIKALAEELAAEVVDVPLAEVEPQDLQGLPSVVDVKREVLTAQVTPRKPVHVTMFDRKKNPVMVTHKRRRSLVA